MSILNRNLGVKYVISDFWKIVWFINLKLPDRSVSTIASSHPNIYFVTLLQVGFKFWRKFFQAFPKHLLSSLEFVQIGTNSGTRDNVW